VASLGEEGRDGSNGVRMRRIERAGEGLRFEIRLARLTLVQYKHTCAGIFNCARPMVGVGSRMPRRDKTSGGLTLLKLPQA